MRDILADFVRVPVKSLLILSALIPLAAVAATPASQAWSPAASASQLAALDYIERLEVARSAGPQAAASVSGIARNFGGIELAAELSQQSGQTVIVVKASGGCVEREIARAKLALGRIVWAPLADSPAPVMGYAHFQGGSASTVFFDATGSRCLTGVRIEDPARLKAAIETAGKEEASNQLP